MTPLKAKYTTEYLEQLGQELQKAGAPTTPQTFRQNVHKNNWEALGLKARTTRIAEALESILPTDFRQAWPIIEQVAPLFQGYYGTFFPEYVARNALHDWEVALPALAYLTAFSTSEFAVRPFLEAEPQQMLAQMAEWAHSPDLHVRRLSSEGARPFLPWARPLPWLAEQPAALMAIVEPLLADPSPYVRRSAANHLNDLSKLLPERVLGFLQPHAGTRPTTDRLIRHALRTLLKSGHPEALQLVGYDGEAEVVQFALEQSQIPLGGSSALQVSIRSKAEQAAYFRLEVALYFLRRNGSYGKKVFKLKDLNLEPSESCSISQEWHFTQRATRKLYPGQQKLGLKINGIEKESCIFTLC